MADGLPSWSHLDDEPMRWFLRFENYRLAGPGRELLGTVKAERAARGSQRQPRKTPGAWSRAYARWRWRERAEAWDKQMAAEAAAAAEAEVKRIMTSGYALRHNRVQALDQLAALLGEQIYSRDMDDSLPNVWLPDVKQIGRGEDAERVDIVRFNAAIFEQYRGALEDLAEEMGERVKKRELTGPKGGPIPISIREVVHELPGDDGTDDLEA